MTLTYIPIPHVRVLWRPEQFNRVTNPIFASATTGWSVTAGINAAGTSITRITTDAYEGSACGSLVCSATDGSGVNWDMGSDRFYSEASYGAIYQVVVWLKRTSGSRRARIILGSEGTTTDRATLTVKDLSDQWRPYIIRWLPAANRTDVQLAVTNGSAEALTVKIGKVLVYQVDAFSQCENGTFEVDTTGWTGYLTGSIARNTGTSWGGSAHGRITASTTAGSGAYFGLGKRTFLSGRTYRLRFGQKTISGSGTWYAEFYDDSGGGSLETVVFTPGADWAWTTLDWTPGGDYTQMEVGFYHVAASGAVLAIDEVDVFEASDDISSPYLRAASWNRGSAFDGGSEVPGDISVTLNDSARRFYPRNAASPLYGSLVAGKRIWGTATWDNELHPLFFGTIDTPVAGGPSLTTTIVAKDPLRDIQRADVRHDFNESDEYWYARQLTLTAVLRANPDLVGLTSLASSRQSLQAGGLEAGYFFNGTDGDVSALDYLDDLNEATGTVHYVKPSVHANIGWVYTTVDRTTLTDTAAGTTIDEDMAVVEDASGTDEAYLNRQEVPWQTYTMMPPPGASESGFGAVMLAYDPDVYVALGSGSEAPYLIYTDDDLGTDDDHAEPRWRYPGGSEKRWRQRIKRGLRVKRRTRVYPDAFVPFSMAAGAVRRFVLDFAVPISGPLIQIDGSTGATNVLIDYIEQRPDRLVVELRAIAADDVDYFAVFGTPWLPGDELTETVDAFDSQASGIVTGPAITTPYIPAPALAQGIGNARLWRFSDGLTRLKVQDQHMPDRQLALDVTSHVTLTADDWDVDALLMVVRRIEAGFSFGDDTGSTQIDWHCWYHLEEIPAHSPWFIIGSSLLGGSDVLAP